MHKDYINFQNNYNYENSKTYCNRTFTGETLLWWMQQKNTPVSNIPTHSVCSYKDLVDKLYKIFRRYNTDDAITELNELKANLVKE